MTETPPADEKPAQAPRKRTGGLAGMLLADLKAMAQALGVEGAGSMKKAQLVDAIKGVQNDHAAQAGAAAEATATRTPQRKARKKAGTSADQPTLPVEDGPAAADPEPSRTEHEQPERDQPKQDQPKHDQPKQDRPKQDQPKQDQPKQDQPKQDQPKQDQPDQQDQGDGEGRPGRNRRRRGRDRNRTNQDGQPGQGGNQGNQGNQGQGNQGQGNQGQGGNQGKGGQDGQGKGQQENQKGQQNRHEPDTSILEDDVVVPAAGILDVLDNYAFVRTSGYLPGPDDVYLSLSMVRRFGLRRGDAIVGQVRHPRDGERREKFNPMVRIDSVNGHSPETARTRAEFAKLTALHPAERLRLENGTADLVGRVLDLTTPLGKGQRALVVSPPDAGKTSLLQSMAASLSANHPECHLMVVLVDERPEEVTDFERSVKGEVIASPFDRPAVDHTSMAELAVERAKRLVELGHDVVILLDGLTRLGRAYALSSQATGRVLPSGLDVAALFPPKRFFGAARTIENGGSLTMVATALVETGSAMDESIFEEFQGTANAVVRLRRELAEDGLFPAVDPSASGTRREDLLLDERELAGLARLRRVPLGTLLDQVRRSAGNAELIAKQGV